MADWYVDSEATGAGTGANWTNAFTTLTAAITASATSDRILVSHAHSESVTTGTQYTFKGTVAAPGVCCSVNKSTGLPAFGGTITATAANWMAVTGNAVCYGMHFRTTNSGVGANQSYGRMTFKACHFSILDPYNTRIGFGSYAISAATVDLIDCWFYYKWAQPATFSFGGGSEVRFIGGGMLPGSSSNSAGTVGEIGEAGRGSGNITFDGFDFSALPAASNIVSGGDTSGCGATIKFNNCKMPASWTGSWVNGTTGLGKQVIVTNCDNADTNYRYEKHHPPIGKITTETTVVRTGGASDGVTPVARRLATYVSASVVAPLETHEILAWNETTGAPITATIEVLTNGVTLTDAECWLEVQYLGTSGFPLSKFVTNAAALLATPVAQPTSTATWTTTGIASPVKQKLQVTFTPQEKGFVQAVVKLGKPSTTVYVCPKLELS